MHFTIERASTSLGHRGVAVRLNGQDAQRHAIAEALLRQNKPDEAIDILGQITDPAMVGGAKSFMETIRKKHPGPKP